MRLELSEIIKIYFLKKLKSSILITVPIISWKILFKDLKYHP